MPVNAWSGVGLKSLVKRPVAALAWVVFPILGGACIEHYAESMPLHISFVLGLFLLITQGILAYDLMLRNSTLHVEASVPVPTKSIRESFRVQWLIVMGSLFLAGAITLSSADFETPTSWIGFVHIILPIWVGVPIYCAALCWLAHGTTIAGKNDKVGEALGQNILPPDVATLVYGLAMVYGFLGVYSLVLHFVLRAWLETGNATALFIVAGAGLVAACSALWWIDQKGLKYVHQASARLRHLDKHGLVVATPSQVPSKKILEEPSRPKSWSMVSPQILRRHPLEPIIVAALLAGAVIRSDSELWQALMFPICLGIWMDLPQRWSRDRLMTPQALNLIAISSSEANASLRKPSLGIVFFVALLSFTGIYLLGSGLERSILLALVTLTTSFFSGFIVPFLSLGGWQIIRFPILIALTVIGIFGGL